MRRLPGALAVVGGALLLYAGVSGNAALWSVIGDVVRPFIQDPGQRVILTVVVKILTVVASLGGLSVVAGGILIYKDRKVLGKFLVFFGAATGLIGLILGVMLTVGQGGTMTQYFTERLNGVAGLVGVILSYVARRLA